MEEKQMNFNKTLQQLRKKAGMSQEELAEQLGVSRQTISKWESASAYPDMLNLITISHFFNVSADELINGISDEPKAVSSEQPGFRCEYKSPVKIGKLPLVHINCGLGNYHAKGIIAIGNSSTGILSIGLIAKGIFSIGVVSLGLIALGVFALGLLSIGCIAAGIIAIAGIAVGIMTLSGVGFGVASISGCAFATHVSVGGVSYAPVAIGFIVKGDEVLVLNDMGEISRTTAESVLTLINSKFPELPDFIKEWATLIFM